MKTVNVKEKLSTFDSFWTPKIVGELNGQHVKLAKLHGDFVWHHHDAEDELFLVVHGSFVMEFEDHKQIVSEGEFIIVPKGVRHRPTAKQPCHVLLFEPKTTLNTGNIINELTQSTLDELT